jgi:hypothetical protein
MASYFDEYAGNLAKVQQEFDSGNRGLFDYVLGTAAYGLGKPAADLVGVPLGYAMDQVPDFIKEGVSDAAVAAGLPEAAQYVGQKIDEYVPENVQRRVGEATMFAEALPMFRGLGILRDPASRGMFTSSGAVYKEGNYRPADVTVSYPEEAVGAVLGDPLKYVANKTGAGKKVESVTGMTPDQILNNVGNFYKKTRGTLKWGADGIGRVANLMFNPSARALYTERGISPVFDKYYQMYKKAEEAGDIGEADKALQLAQSQMQQMANIKKQSGQVTRGEDATKDFINAAADPDAPEVFFNAGEAGKGWYHDSASQAKSVIRGIDKTDSDFIENHVMRVWKADPNRTEIIVKTPRSDYTGNHFEDVLARNTNLTQVAKLFSDSKGDFVPFESPEALKEAIQELNKSATTYKRASGDKKAGDVKRNKATGEKEKDLFSISKVDDDGVWLQMSKAGQAKVEGGVNMLIKVDVNGNLTGVMSDLHDFYEKIPTSKIAKLGNKIGNALLDKTDIDYRLNMKLPDVPNVPLRLALPKNVIAVSPPMQTNVVSITGKTFNDKTKSAMGLKQADTTPTPEAAMKAAVRDRVEAAGQIKASTGEVLRESLPVAQNVALVGGGVASNFEEDPFAYDPELFGTQQITP